MDFSIEHINNCLYYTLGILLLVHLCILAEGKGGMGSGK